MTMMINILMLMLMIILIIVNMYVSVCYLPTLFVPSLSLLFWVSLSLVKNKSTLVSKGLGLIGF